jgi:hypothetical protein
MDKKSRMTRREFAKGTATAGAGLAIVPRHVLGRGLTPPSDLLNIAAVGVGGMGRANLSNLASQNIVALCDVDWGYAEQGFDRLGTDIENLQKRIAGPDPEPQPGRPLRPFDREAAKERLDGLERLKDVHLPKARRYTDYREMLDKQKDIDAVLVATADHMHAPIARAAMELKKHVYVQKPLTWCVSEARQLARLANETKVATQMGNQGHSMDDARKTVEYVWAGAIGEVREVHIWTNRPLGFWPQGVPRPAVPAEPLEALHWNGPGLDKRLAAAMTGNYPVPAKLNWDLFLGVAPKVDYHPVYHPFNWRGWVDWGMGPLGDMGAHLMDHSLWALALGYPTSVETISTPFNQASYPAATMTIYEFPAREADGRKLPPVKLTWYDGGLMPATPAELGDAELDKGGGALLVGSKGKLLHETYGLNPRLLPNSLHQAFGKPPEKLPRIVGQRHEMNWVDAAKGKTQASCPFDYAARLTEVMLLGIVALRAGRKIDYDGANMRVTNVSGANDYLKRDYRTGW